MQREDHTWSSGSVAPDDSISQRKLQASALDSADLWDENEDSLSPVPALSPSGALSHASATASPVDTDAPKNDWRTSGWTNVPPGTLGDVARKGVYIYQLKQWRTTVPEPLAWRHHGDFASAAEAANEAVELLSWEYGTRDAQIWRYKLAHGSFSVYIEDGDRRCRVLVPRVVPYAPQPPDPTAPVEAPAIASPLPLASYPCAKTWRIEKTLRKQLAPSLLATSEAPQRATAERTFTIGPLRTDLATANRFAAHIVQQLRRQSYFDAEHCVLLASTAAVDDAAAAADDTGASARAGARAADADADVEQAYAATVLMSSDLSVCITVRQNMTSSPVDQVLARFSTSVDWSSFTTRGQITEWV